MQKVRALESAGFTIIRFTDEYPPPVPLWRGIKGEEYERCYTED